MLYAQFSGRKSLRDLVFSLNQQVKKLYHLWQTPVKRSTLSDANEQWPAIIFEKTYHKLLPRIIHEKCLKKDRVSGKMLLSLKKELLSQDTL